MLVNRASTEAVNGKRGELRTKSIPNNILSYGQYWFKVLVTEYVNVNNASLQTCGKFIITTILPLSETYMISHPNFKKIVRIDFLWKLQIAM